MPEISVTEKIHYLTNDLHQNKLSDFTQDLISNPVRAVGDNIGVTLISNETARNAEINTPILSIRGTSQSDFTHNSIFSFPLFHNQASHLKFYVDKVKYGFLDSTDLSEIQAFSVDDIRSALKLKSIKKIYSKIPGNFNHTSMAMLSMGNYCDVYNIGILLTGDMFLNTEAQIKNLCSHYSAEANQINHFIVPHHGSGKNMLRAITEFPIKAAYIQERESSRKLIKQVAKKHTKEGIDVFHVSEQRWTQLVHHF
jgi:hypothetical protein